MVIIEKKFLKKIHKDFFNPQIIIKHLLIKIIDINNLIKQYTVLNNIKINQDLIFIKILI